MTSGVVIPGTPEAWVATDNATRADFRWPLAFPEIIDEMAAFYRRYVDATIAQPDHELRSILLLGRRAMPVLALLQYALLTAAARQSGQRLVGDDLIDFLADGGDKVPPTLRPIAQPKVGTRWLWPRRLARTRSWTSTARLPRAMLFPSGVALTHNSLLRTHLRGTPDAVRNAYDEDFSYTRATPDSAFIGRIDPVGLATHMTSVLTAGVSLDDDITGRLKATLRPVLAESYADAAELLGRLRGVRRLPARLFTGTGNKRMSRALGLEIMRRGGDVTRCDHGGSFVLLHPPDYIALNELSVSTRYVVPTREVADAPEMRAARDRVRPLAACTLEGATGDPGLDVGAPAFKRSTAPSKRRRAMYVSSVFYGMFQASPPVLAGPLYLDWQTRFIEQLKALPIDLVCKPHPGGYRPPPELDPTRGVRVATAPFEHAVADADVIIYDFPATTTLAVGLCTDRPIVLVDHGTMRFNPSLRDAISARCSFVRASYDDRNRPVISNADLEAAICAGPAIVDPTVFRRLFLGSKAAERS